MIRSSAILATAASLSFAAALQSLPAAASPCVGFTDVDTSSTFCKNVEWMKNRGITLGCGAGTTYCPTDPVTRLSMAAFMNRIGNVLVPQYINNACGGVFSTGSTIVCTYPDVLAVGYPRTFVLDGSVYGVQGTLQNAAGMYLLTEQSTDGGSSWSSIDYISPAFALPGNGAIQSLAFTLPANLPLRLRHTAHLDAATNVNVQVITRIRLENGISFSPPY